MPAAERTWTVEEVQALPADGNRYEVVDGELLVTPAPRLLHQAVVTELLVRLDDYLEEQRVGYVFAAPADIVLDGRTLVQPDVFVAAPVEGRRPREWSDVRELLLAIEVLSPASAHADRTLKRRLYQRSGIPEYWIADVDARVVERWRPGDDRAELLENVIEWAPSGASNPLHFSLRELFVKVHDV